MIYTFDRYKNVSVNASIIMLASSENESYSVGCLIDDETREQNSINKVFSAKDNRTVNEVRAERESAQFMNDWLERWEGEVSDKTANKKSTASAPAKKTSSLFA